MRLRLTAHRLRRIAAAYALLDLAYWLGIKPLVRRDLGIH